MLPTVNNAFMDRLDRKGRKMTKSALVVGSGGIAGSALPREWPATDDAFFDLFGELRAARLIP